MKSTAFFDGQDVLKEDLEFDGNGVRERVLENAADGFGATAGFPSGGFVSGGATTPNGGDPTKVDIAAALGYCADGERFNLSPQTAVVIPNLVGGNNYVLISYTQFQDTPVSHPVTQVVHQTRNQELTSIVVLSTFTPGDANGQGHPYVPVALVTRPGGIGPLVIQDLRQFPKNLGVNTVDTPQLVNRAVTTAKLADYVKPIIWDVNPDIYWDREEQKLKARINGFFHLEGASGTNALVGLPQALTEPGTGIRVVVGTFLVPNVCTVTLAAITDFSSLAKQNVIVLGYVDTNGSFINFQAPQDDELFLLSEETSNVSAQRIKANENMWRRFNESFQSFTSGNIDGVAAGSPNTFHQLVPSGSDVVVSPGLSYVAGKRIQTSAPITLSASNTANFVPAPGSNIYDFYILRTEDSQLYRFDMLPDGNPAPLNSYQIATVEYSGGLPNVITDKRVFSPVPEAVVVSKAAQGIKVGAKLRNNSVVPNRYTQIIVDPGIIGFPNGEVRVNKRPKILDFGASYGVSGDIRTAHRQIGYLQTQQAIGGLVSPVGLEKFGHYAIFATADHPGMEFNLVAAKVSFVKGVSGASAPGQFVYTFPPGITIPLNRQFYPGQRIVAKGYGIGSGANGDPTLTSASPNNNGLGYDGNGITHENTLNPEVIDSVASTVKTAGGVPGPGPGPTGNVFANGSFAILNRLRPDPVLTLINPAKFRLLGIVTCNGETLVPKLRVFESSEDLVRFTDTGDFSVNALAWHGMYATTFGYYKDLGNHLPPMARIARINSKLNYRVCDGNVGDWLAWFIGGRPWDATVKVDYQNAPSSEVDSFGKKMQFNAHVNLDVDVYMNCLNISYGQGATSGGSSFAVGTVTWLEGYRFNIFDEWALQDANSADGFNTNGY